MKRADFEHYRSLDRAKYYIVNYGENETRIKLSMANEIRAWLGCQPFAKAPKATSAAELERARKLLERNGWRVEPPNAGGQRAGDSRYAEPPCSQVESKKEG